MGIAELIIVLNQLLSTANSNGLNDVAQALASNISVFASGLGKEATKISAKTLGNRWAPWWSSITEESFKSLVRLHLKEAGSDAERFKRSVSTVAELRGLPAPLAQLAWIDDVVRETLGQGR